MSYPDSAFSDINLKLTIVTCATEISKYCESVLDVLLVGYVDLRK